MKFLIVKHILLVSNVGNVQGTVWRICTLMLGCKGLIQDETRKETKAKQRQKYTNSIKKVEIVTQFAKIIFLNRCECGEY